MVWLLLLENENNSGNSVFLVSNLRDPKLRAVIHKKGKVVVNRKLRECESGLLDKEASSLEDVFKEIIPMF